MLLSQGEAKLARAASYWSSHLFHDPLPVYAKLDIPIVAAMGENDESEPIESGRLLRDYFVRNPARKSFRFIEYKGATHGLQRGQKLHVKDFVAHLAGWFQNDRLPFGTPPATPSPPSPP